MFGYFAEWMEDPPWVFGHLAECPERGPCAFDHFDMCPVASCPRTLSGRP